MLTKEERCKAFLMANGWELDSTIDFNDDPLTYHKKGCCSVDIDDDQIVLVGEDGDFLELPIDYFALIGALINFRQIGCDYIQVRQPERS